MKYLIFFSLFFITCQEQEAVNNDETAVNNEDLEMYVPSELATLMKGMFLKNQDWKEEILKGNIPTEFPEEYRTIHKAQSVNEKTSSDFYNTMSTSYITTIEELTKATPENVKEKYNNMVNVCVSCHMQICPGPVVRIKKLIIK